MPITLTGNKELDAFLLALGTSLDRKAVDKLISEWNTPVFNFFANDRFHANTWINYYQGKAWIALWTVPALKYGSVVSPLVLPVVLQEVHTLNDKGVEQIWAANPGGSLNRLVIKEIGLMKETADIGICPICAAEKRWFNTDCPDAWHSVKD